MSLFFFFNDTATTEIYTLSLHDALPIFAVTSSASPDSPRPIRTSRLSVLAEKVTRLGPRFSNRAVYRSEEHTSELQSHSDLVCRLLLEKKKKKNRQERHNYLNISKYYPQ